MSKALTPYIKALLNEPPTLSQKDFAKALRLVFDGDANDIETSSFLTALQIKKVDCDSEYIATAVDTILEYSDKIPEDAVDSDGYLDIVGTGGDSQNTFNVSTSCAIIGAGMGLNVCKHGGKASTSKSGAGDLMAKLGVQLMNINAKTAPKVVSQSNLCFLFAPAFHHGMGKVVNVRKNLGIPTIFNILGPLLNPIKLKGKILGVYTPELGKTYCEAAVKADKMKGREPAYTLVVCGDVGLDEISPEGKTHVWKYDPKSSSSIEEFTISPADFGLSEHSLDLVRSGTPQENADKLREILSDKDAAPGKDALVDYLLLNASALAVVGGLTDDWKEGVKIALESITSGKALKALDKFVSIVADL